MQFFDEVVHARSFTLDEIYDFQAALSQSAGLLAMCQISQCFAHSPKIREAVPSGSSAGLR